MRVTVSESLKESFDSRLNNRRLIMRDNIYVFLDFEFNCPEQRGVNKREIISMAAVFRYSDGSPLTSFYSVVKPSRSAKISARTKRLTGITQGQINRSQSFDKVSEQFLELVECFSPSEFFVWGSADSVEVQKSARYSHADKRIDAISRKFHDLQVDVMEELKLPNPYNLERAADIYGIDFTHTFSAIADAECLAEIYFAYKRGIYDDEKLRIYRKFYEYRDIVGKYKLIMNNIKTSEYRIENLRKNAEELSDDIDAVRRINGKIEDTQKYISSQKSIADSLSPKVKEAEKFLSENGSLF